MLNLTESLKGKNVSELKDIARENKISGFATLRKEELVTLLAQNMKSKDFSDSLRGRLSDTMLLFLDIIIEDANEKKYSELKIDFLDFRSATTFYKIYNQLMSFGIVFEEEDKEGMIRVFIPKDLQKIIREIVGEKSERKDSQRDDLGEDKTEEDIALYTTFKTIDGLLYSSYLPIDNLKRFLINNKMDVVGSKKDLVNKILYDSDILLEDSFDELFSKTILQDICINLQIPKSGIKQDIINRIIGRLPAQKPNLVKTVIKTSARSVGSKAENHNLMPPIEKPPKPKADTGDKLYDNPEKFVKYLMSLKPPKPKDEEYLEQFLYGVLMGKFGNKVNKQESGRKGKSRYDITLEDTVLIELKVATTKRNVSDGIGQLITYLGETERYKYGILGVYDASRSRNLKSQLREKYANVYIVFW